MGLTCGGHGAKQSPANAGFFWLRRHRTGAIPTHKIRGHEDAANGSGALVLVPSHVAGDLPDGRVLCLPDLQFDHDGRAVGPTAQSADRAGERLTGRALTRRVVLAMIKRRAGVAAELPPSSTPSRSRGTRRPHKTTKLYDRDGGHGDCR